EGVHWWRIYRAIEAESRSQTGEGCLKKAGCTGLRFAALSVHYTAFHRPAGLKTEVLQNLTAGR
ncbi:MAG: hypothetical protein AAFQ99_10325, partial [Pseudomonadota bacterium]